MRLRSAAFGVVPITASVLVACASAPKTPAPSSPGPVALPDDDGLGGYLAKAPPVPPLPQTRRIAVRLAFDAKGLHVRVTANGDAPELARWKMPEDVMTEVAVEDGHQG